MRRFIVTMVVGLVAALLPAVVGSAEPVGPPRVTIKISDTQVAQGSTIRVAGRARPARSQPLKLQANYGRGWRTLERSASSARGRYVFTEKVKTLDRRSYRVCAIGRSATCSRAVTVNVRSTGAKTQPSLRVTGVASEVLMPGERHDISGIASADLVGKAVYLQLATEDEGWSSISEPAVVAEDGTWRLTAPAKQAGRRLPLRVYAPPTRSTHSAWAFVNGITVYGWRYLDRFRELAGWKEHESASVDAVTYPRSVWAAAGYTYFEVNLGRECTTLAASVGLSDTSPATARKTLTVTGDSQELFRQTGVKRGETTEIDVDVTGVSRLRIDDNPENGDAYPAILGNARVLCAFS